MPTSDLYEDKNGIEWHENNKEVTINGKFHEVIRVEKGTGTSILYLIKDDKENELFAAFFSKKIQNDHLIFHLIKLVFSMQILPEFEYDFSERVSDIPSGLCLNESFTDSKFNFRIIKPPQFFLFY